MDKRSQLLVVMLTLSLLVIACSPVTASEPSTEESDGATAQASATSTLQPVTLAMGYIPNVQFAPFYVAAEKGYFADEGIELSFDYGMENDLVQLVATDELQFAIASGEQVLLARAREMPVRYVANWYRRFPVAVTSIELDLKDPASLENKVVALPGLYGANYVGWLALAHATGIDTEKVQLEPVGFEQIPVLTEGRADAAVVYATNEPLQLEMQGYSPHTIYVADYIDLVANGLITNEKTIEAKPELVQGMVRAMLRGIQDTLQNPDEAFEIVTSKWVEEAGGENAETQRAVLEATLSFWENEAPGTLPRSAWESSRTFMLESDLLEKEVEIDGAYTNEFAEKALE